MRTFAKRLSCIHVQLRKSYHYRRLAIRYERREELHQAFLDRACALLCLKTLRRQTQELCNE